MKSFVAYFAILIGVISVHGQIVDSPLLRQCETRRQVGVEIRSTGFQNPVEVQRLAAAMMNLDLVPADQDYCLTPAAGLSERRLDARVQVKTLGRNRTTDGLKPQLIRSGIRIGVGEAIRRLPYGTRSTVRQVSRQYTVEPRVTLYQIQVTAQTTLTLTSEKQILWQGNGSRIFTVRETYYPGGYQPKKIEVLDEAGRPVNISAELQQYGDAVSRVKAGTDLSYRAEELMRLVVLKQALQPANLIQGGQVLLARNAPQ